MSSLGSDVPRLGFTHRGGGGIGYCGSAGPPARNLSRAMEQRTSSGNSPSTGTDYSFQSRRSGLRAGEVTGAVSGVPAGRTSPTAASDDSFRRLVASRRAIALATKEPRCSALRLPICWEPRGRRHGPAMGEEVTDAPGGGSGGVVGTSVGVRRSFGLVTRARVRRPSERVAGSCRIRERERHLGRREARSRYSRAGCPPRRGRRARA